MKRLPIEAAFFVWRIDNLKLVKVDGVQNDQDHYNIHQL